MSTAQFQGSFSSPFVEDRYQGEVDIKIYQDETSSANYIQVFGERVKLEVFHGPHYNKFKSIFGDLVQKRSNEFEDMKEIFGNSLTRTNYGDGMGQTDGQIRNRIEFNARRALSGNPFTGFAAIEKTTNKIIAFVSIGKGYQRGESQSALVVNQNYQRRHYSREIAVLASSLAYVYFLNRFEVGPRNRKGPVQKFTASCMDRNERSIIFIKNLGMKYIRPLFFSETYSKEPTSLYGIDAKDVESNLKRFIPLKNITWEVIKK